MAMMFCEAESFTGAGLSLWSVDNVQDLSYAFYYAPSFRSDLASWKVDKVEYFDLAFKGTVAFDSDLAAWNVSQGRSFIEMFADSTMDRSLCDWGPKIRPGANVELMFLGSNCPTDMDPNLTATPPGPFCHECL